jgi:hypothetical protein
MHLVGFISLLSMMHGTTNIKITATYNFTVLIFGMSKHHLYTNTTAAVKFK